MDPVSQRLVIFGNSGSGKSTLARAYAQQPGMTHLDLDTIAWDETGKRSPLTDSLKRLDAFIATHKQWVIEGCYGSLLGPTVNNANEVIFLNPGVTTCQENCGTRPWEPHKYKTAREQEQNLPMLLDWVADYYSREDEFSFQVHREIFDRFTGKKREVLNLSDLTFQ